MKRNPHQRLFSLYPLFQLCLAFAAGVLASNLQIVRFPGLIVVCAVSSLFGLAIFAKEKLRLAGLSLLISFFFAGATLAVIEDRTKPPNSLQQLFDNGCLSAEQPAVLTGVLDQPPEFARDRIYLVLRIESVATRSYDSIASGTVTLLATFKTATSEQEFRQLDLHYGSRVRVRATLNRVDQYRNPGVSTLTDYLDRKGYDAVGVVKSSDAILSLNSVTVFKPLQWLYQWRQNLQGSIDQRFSPETAGVLDAAFLGNRHNLSKSTVEHFREGGTFHVLVISGLHISFVGGVVLLLARRFTKRRILQCLMSSSVVWGYSIAVGADASVVRAALMFSFIAFGTMVFRSTSALNGLGAAGLILLVKSPKDLFDPSLQLTFLSVLAIVAIAWPLLQTFKAIGSWRPTQGSPYPPRCSRFLRTVCEALYWSEAGWRKELDRTSHDYRLFKTPLAKWLERTHLQRPLRYIFSAMVVSIGVQIVLLPLLIIYFHRLSLSSLILNIFVSPLLAVFGMIAVVALLISQLSLTLAGPFFELANLIDRLMVHSVDPFSAIGLASIRLPDYTGWRASIYFLYFLPLTILLVALSRWRPLNLPVVGKSKSAKFIFLAGGFQIFLLGFVVFHPLSSVRSEGKLRIDFLDVGQGDSALVTMPDGTTLLVDGGGRPSFVSTSTASDGASQSLERDVRSIGEMVVSEYLWWRGLNSIDYVLATHADADHIDGLSDVIRNFSVRSALVARTPGDDPEYSKFSQTLTATNTHLELIHAGDQLQFGGVTAVIIYLTDRIGRRHNLDASLSQPKAEIRLRCFASFSTRCTTTGWRS
jgi:competence protein ComEC